VTVIRQLTADDLESAFTLSATAGWNQRLEDWRMLLTLAPAGCFAAVAHGRIVGTSIGINYRTFGWIAMMLVDPEYRGHGLGAQLLQAAMDAVPSNLPVRLDATPLGRPLYERHGFVEETSLTRLVAHAPDGFPRSVETIERATASDVPEIINIDGSVFGADRTAVFDWSVTDARYARIGRDGDRVLGYCFGRGGRVFDHIGPVIAREEDQARALVSSVIADVPGRPVAIDAYDRQERFCDWLRSIGFRAERPLFRMARGAMPNPRSTAILEFAIFGPDFG
jgi:GNAT superfamily N-acetyltransferase